MANFFDQFDTPAAPKLGRAPRGGAALPPGFEVEDWQPVGANGLPPGFEVMSVPAGGKAPNYFDQFDPVVAAPQTDAQGVAKQIGSGLIEGAANIPFTAPQLLKQVGDVIGERFGLPKAQPIINAPPTPTEALTAALPQPQNETEAAVRNLSQYPASILTGGKNHLLENTVGALGAGAGSYLGPQVGPSFGLTPDESSIVGAVLGGYAGSRPTGNAANLVTRRAMPKPQEIINQTSNMYDNLREANREIVIPPDVMGTLKNGLLRDLRDHGPAEEQAKKTYSVINGLDSENGGTMRTILNARQNLHKIVHGGDGADIPAAIIALDGVDTLIDLAAKPGTMAQLKTADANWSAARTAQAVDTKIKQAEDRAEGANSGMNAGNNIIQNINAFIKRRTDPDTGKIHINPSDLEALNSARKLDLGEKINRLVSGSFGGGGGRDLTAAVGLGVLGALGANKAGLSATDESDPLIAGLGVPMAGLMLRHMFNRAVVRNAKNAEAAILARAPYMEGVAVPRSLLSAPQVAGRSLLFAAPALRDQLAPSDAQ